MGKAYRDNRDRIVAWEKGFNPGVNPRENGREDRYHYDNAGQLTQAAYQAENAHDTAGTAERVDSFYYDEMGNRTGANWVASRGLMRFAGRNNKLNQYGIWENNIPWPDPLHWGLDLWYDDGAPEPGHAPWLPPGNGVLMGDGWNVAAFNALNQPVQMTSFFYEGTGNWMWFGYDPLGRCVKRWVGPGDGSAPNGATYFYYDGWNLVQEGLSANSVARTYVHGAGVDEIVASAAAGGSWLYHQYDARGHCIMLTNPSGGIVEQYEYDAFGQPYIYDANSTLVARNLGSPAGNRFLFTGREWLKELRVYDYRNRMYQPELGRFVQPDPKEFEAGDYNLYRYCYNDPINKSDPTGLDTAVAIGGMRDDSINFFGHASMALTGQGTFSSGTGTPPGSNFTNFMASQASHRYTHVYILHTNAKQEAAMKKNFEEAAKKPLPNVLTSPKEAHNDNCTTRVADALRLETRTLITQNPRSIVSHA